MVNNMRNFIRDIKDDDYIEVLYDVKSKDAKEITWRTHKLITLRLAQAYKRIDSQKYSRIIDCAGYMEFRRYDDNTLRLHTANFCQTRLCPTCNWRRARKVYANVSTIIDSLENNYKFVFLTLTCRNVTGEILSKTMNTLYHAYKTLCTRITYKAAVRGWCKVFEITYNWNTQEYHPHFHCILAVDNDYFTSDLYIRHQKFCELWKSCLNVDYIPIVDVRVFTESEKGKGKEVAEVAKYTLKSSNIMANLTAIKPYTQDIQSEVKRITDNITDEIVITLDSALANRRLIGYGGVFRKKHKELNLNDDDNLIRAGDDDTAQVLDYQIERYGWHPGYRQYLRLDSSS